MYAITSAGVVHAVAQGCIRGDLKNCFCNQTELRGKREDFVWSGCYDHIAHGIEVAKFFVDSDEQQNDARAKMNLHNNMVGRTVSPEIINKQTPMCFQAFSIFSQIDFVKD